MKITLSVLFAIVMGAAQAQTVQVPCEEFNQVMAARTPCKSVPVVKVDAAKWEERKVGNARRQCLVDNGEDKLPPWQRSNKCDHIRVAQSPSKPAPTLNECSLPPWKRAEGVKCD